MKKRKTGFESFAQVFLIVTIVVFVFGIISYFFSFLLQ